MNRHSHPRQRVDSSASVASKLRGERSVVARLDQRGGAKIRLPRSESPTLDAVLVNTAGGLTGGDRIDWQAEALAGSELRVTTAACEKLYRSEADAAIQTTSLRVASGARLLWLPQETIVYDRAQLTRQLDAVVDGDGQLVLCESLVFGRRAMGESVLEACIRDNWTIHRDDRLVHREALRIDATRDLQSGSDAAFGKTNPYRALTTLVYCVREDAPQLERMAERVRACLMDTTSGVAGVTVLPGRLVFRLLAVDSHAMRGQLIPVLTSLLGSSGVPRIWTT